MTEGMACPNCGVSLAADVTLRQAETELAKARFVEAEMAKAHLAEAECRAREAQCRLDDVRQRAQESEMNAARCEAEWRHSQELVARMRAEVEMLGAEAAGAR